MIIYPAIDLIAGEVVRLHKGDFAQKTTYGTDPVAVARSYANVGADWLHLVDLDGAKDPAHRQTDLIGRIIAGSGLTVPHMGWNRLIPQAGAQANPLLAGIAPEAHVYFVHSYFAELSADTIASCDYGEAFTAIAGNGNFMGCQFHPERSGSVGEQILRNFLEL